MFRSIQPHQSAPQTVQVLSDALVQIWDETPQDGICLLLDKHTGAMQTSEYHSELL